MTAFCLLLQANFQLENSYLSQEIFRVERLKLSQGNRPEVELTISRSRVLSLVCRKHYTMDWDGVFKRTAVDVYCRRVK